MQRQGSLAMVSPCVSSSKQMTHSPLSSFKTSSTKYHINNNQFVIFTIETNVCKQ